MTSPAQTAQQTCFFERDPTFGLARRSMVEAVGTLMLMLVICSSGLAARHLLPASPSLGIVVSAVTTAGALVAMILAFGAVSGGHFNPLISGLQWLAGERTARCAAAYIAAQLAGGIAGALLATTILGGDSLAPIPAMAGWQVVVSEVLATTGLLIVVFGCARSGRADSGPFAVGAWLVAAIITMPSTAYANPAVTLAAIFTTGPVALPANTGLVFVAAELAGALLAFVVVAVAYPVGRDSELAAP